MMVLFQWCVWLVIAFALAALLRRKPVETAAPAAFAIILLLYLILFPAGLERNLILMDSMGATCVERMGHVALSSFGILFTGTLLGCTGGALLWNQVVEELTRSAEVSLELHLDPMGFVQIAGGHLFLSMTLILTLSLWMTRPRTLAGRR